MSAWPVKPLGEVFELQRGHDLPTRDRNPGHVPIIGSFGITGSHDVSKYSGPGVAIGRSGAAIGTATYVDEPYWPLNTCLFVSDFKGNDPRWVYHLLNQMDFTQFNSGSAQPSLNRNFLRDIPLAVPTIQEQHAIAEVLGTLDDKIAANTKLVKTVDELATALISQAISSGPELPLLELAEITMGSSPAGTSLNESGEGIVFYQGVRDFGVRYPERRIWTDAPVRFAEELDTLFSVRAPVGRANIAPEKLCIGRGLASLRSRFGAPYTLFHAVKSSQVWQRFDSEGTVFGSINRKQLEAVTLNWVSPQELESLETNLASLENLLRTSTSTNETLAATRDALLPQLMSGKLQVKDAEKIVEDTL